jgi:hypothetical protein
MGDGAGGAVIRGAGIARAEAGAARAATAAGEAAEDIGGAARAGGLAAEAPGVATGAARATTGVAAGTAAGTAGTAAGGIGTAGKVALGAGATVGAGAAAGAFLRDPHRKRWKSIERQAQQADRTIQEQLEQERPWLGERAVTKSGKAWWARHARQMGESPGDAPWWADSSDIRVKFTSGELQLTEETLKPLWLEWMSYEEYYQPRERHIRTDRY